MWCGLVVCLLAAVVCGVRAAPHIVVIMADDLGFNDVSFRGSSQILTPNIDALAYAGVVLDKHYAQPTCSPSRTAFNTGRYPAYTGMLRPISSGTTNALPLNFTLLPQYLNQLGYRSHLVGKWHLGSHRSEYLPTHRGFHSHFGFWNGYVGYYDGIHLQPGRVGLDARRDDAEAWQEVVGHYLTDLLAQEAVSVIEAHDSGKGPLYLQVAFSAPHTGNRGTEFEVRDLTANEQQHSHISDVHRKLYAGMVRALDDGVGTIMEALRSRDMVKDLIVLFTSDNGAPTLDPQYNYGNQGSNWPLRGMKSSSHEGGVRTAAALWSPLVAGGRVYDQLIHMVDWLPTLYTAAGGDVGDLGELDGVNQWEALRGNEGHASNRTELLVELNADFGNEALIQWPWKIIKDSSKFAALHTHAGQSGRGSEVPEYSVDLVTGSPASHAVSLNRSREALMALRAQANIDHRCPLELNSTGVATCDQHYCLFNLESDPCERTDLSAAHPSTVASLKQLLDAHRQGVVVMPQSVTVANPLAHPKNWHNYWVPWADDQPSGAQSRGVLCSVLAAGLTAALVLLS